MHVIPADAFVYGYQNNDDVDDDDTLVLGLCPGVCVCVFGYKSLHIALAATTIQWWMSRKQSTLLVYFKIGPE